MNNNINELLPIKNRILYYVCAIIVLLCMHNYYYIYHMRCLDYYDIRIIIYSRVIVMLYIHSHTEYTWHV